MRAIQGSILDFDGDAVVNPANSHLNHGGGLAAVIDRAAQDLDGEVPPPIAPNTPHPGLAAIHRYRAEQAHHPLIPTGGAGVTSAGQLPFEGIIHAVGPVWGGGRFYEGELLILAHRSAILAAFGAGWKRIAFPAISCGIFGYPVAEAAPLAVAVAKSGEANYGVESTFYLFEDEHYAAYVGAIQ